jgi:hypothetical protein
MKRNDPSPVLFLARTGSIREKGVPRPFWGESLSVPLPPFGESKAHSPTTYYKGVRGGEEYNNRATPTILSRLPLISLLEVGWVGGLLLYPPTRPMRIDLFWPAIDLKNI